MNGALRKEFPFKPHFITVAGHRMHYVDEGQGPVILLLHGNPTWSFYYRNLIKLLKDDFRVIAPDFIGLGLSDRPADAHFRTRDRVSQLSEFLDRLQIEKFSLVAHDWGGSIGSMVAAENPERIQKIVYLNTTLTETEALPALIKIAATPFIGKILTKYTKRFLYFTTVLGVGKKLPKIVREGYYFPYKTAQSRQAIWDFVDDIPFDSSHPSYSEMLTLAERLPRLNHCPVQIIWGLRDPCFHRAMLDKVARHFPQARVLEIPDASHLVLEDAPELAGETILHFFKNGTAVENSANGVHSVPLRQQQNALYESFCTVAQEVATQPAAIEPLFLGEAVRYGHTSFCELAERINKYQRGLNKLGLCVGDRVLMLVPAGVEFLALSFAVMGRGAIPIFVDPGMGREALFRCIQDADPNVFIGAPKAQLLRLKRSQLFPNLRFHITASDWFYTGGPGLSYLKRFSSKPLPAVNAPDSAFIAFTSGATGTPKGVVYTNDMLRQQLRILKSAFGFRAGDRDLPLLPIFSLFHLANGVCSVFPAIDSSRPLSLSPSRILRIVHDLQVKSSFGSPTLWNKIAEYCVRSGETLGSLKRIFMAGAPVSKRVIERVGEVMQEGETYTPYGATEALPVTLLSGSEIRSKQDSVALGGEAGTRVGKPVEGVSLRVVQEIDESDPKLLDMPPLEIGEIVVSGLNVSPEYFRREEANKRAKLVIDGVLWHRMGDLGYLDEADDLYFCGRAVHRVHTRERVYYSVPTERIFNTHEKVKRSALVDMGKDNGAGIVIEPFPEFWPGSDEERTRFLNEIEHLAKQHELTKDMRWFFLHPSFPVDARHNAKIFRDQLSEWAKKFVQVEQVA